VEDVVIRTGLAVILVVSLEGRSAGAQLSEVPEPPRFPEPRTYVCPRVEVAPTIDGDLDDAGWKHVPWTEDFVDIEGGERRPGFRTRCRLAWDDSALYIAADLEEPRLRASIREHDGVLYRDNNFEVFLDPDRDTHDYYEIEMNAWGTVWDLFLVRAYRDGGPVLTAWDLRGLRTAVGLRGTLNDDRDVDEGWSVEIAVPWAGIREHAHTDCPPRPGDQWRVNLGRVEWPDAPGADAGDRPVDPYTGEPHPEDNWTWSPPGIVSLHYPELWGVVQFSGEIAGTAERYVPSPLIAGRRALRMLYYRERNRFHREGTFTTDVGALGLESLSVPGWSWPPELHVTPHWFEASTVNEDGVRVSISRDGREW